MKYEIDFSKCDVRKIYHMLKEYSKTPKQHKKYSPITATEKIRMLKYELGLLEKKCELLEKKHENLDELEMLKERIEKIKNKIKEKI